MAPLRRQSLCRSQRSRSDARWIERCMVGSEPLPSSLKIQLACCLLAAGVVLSLEQGLAKVAESW